MDASEIEKRVDRAIAGPVEIKADVGLDLATLGQVMEFAKLMAVSGAAVPKYLRNNPGACLAITTRALRWQMDPFAVAEKSYMVTNKGEERVAFESQLVHAVITSHAPLKGRLRYEIIGEGNERRCKVWGTFKGETEPHVYTSETLGKMLDSRPKRRDDQGYGGSPLWDTNPEVQLAYSSVRQWCRLFSSETLLGVYTPDEMDNEPVDITPQVGALAQRLKDRIASDDHRGFDADSVLSGAKSVIEGGGNDVTATTEAKHEDSKGGDGEAGGSGERPIDDGAVRNPDQVGGAGASGDNQAVRAFAARQGGEKIEDKGEAGRNTTKAKRAK